MRVISHSVSDGLVTLHVCVWWWDGLVCKVSWPFDAEREIVSCVQIANFYVGNLQFCKVKTEDLGARDLTFDVRWPWNFARMYMVMGVDVCAKFHGHSDVERKIVCVQIANFYVGNLHFCIGKKRGFGHARDLTFCVRMAIKLCNQLDGTHVYGDGIYPRAKFHGHRIPNVRSRASKSPISM